MSSQTPESPDNKAAMDDEKKSGHNGQATLNAPEEQTLLEKQDLMSTPDKAQEAIGFKGIENFVPHDRFRMVYFILLLHGIGTLMPWNMFINANDYFVKYKLASPENTTSPEVAAEAAVYRTYFLNALGFVAQSVNVLLNGLNMFMQFGGGNTVARIVWSIIVVVIMFIVTVILAMLDSSTWPGAFFWITMVTVVIINMANGVYQNSIYGTAACLPMKYTNAVVLGSNTSGTVTAVLNILAIAIAPNPRTAAIYYFLTAIVVLLVAFDTYLALPLMPFFRYYQDLANKNVPASSGQVRRRPPYWYIFKQCWVQDLSVFCVFFVTLACFPAVQAGIRPSDPEFFINDTYYSAVTCFLFFNAFAVLGNLASEFVQLPGPKWVWIPILLRLLFIPFFMMCNFQPRDGVRRFPTVINNDYVYILGGISMAFTSGYFSSLTMMYAPRNVKPEHQGTAGMMAAFFLILGIFGGVLFSLPLVALLTDMGLKPDDLPALVNTTTVFPLTTFA